MKFMIFPAGENKITFAAEGRGAEKSLAVLAGLTGLGLTDGADGRDVLLTDRDLPEADGVSRFIFPYTPGCPAAMMPDGSMIVKHDRSLPAWLSGEFPLMVELGVLRHMFSKNSVFLMHGALLELEPGQGIILFGHSGVGKSTSVLRCRIAGRKCRADDMIFCFRDKGRLMASPIPTPSYCREYWSRDLCYPFLPSLPVVRMINLRRGEKEEKLVNIHRDEFMPALVHALSLHLFNILRGWPAGLRRKCGNLILDTAEKLCSVYPMLACEAHLSGDIIKTLTGDNHVEAQ